MISLRQVAESWGVTPSRVRQMIDRGEMAAEKHRGCWFVEEAEAERAMRARRPPGRPRAKYPV